MPTKPTIPEKKSTDWTDQEILGLDQDRWRDLLSNNSTKVRAAAEAIQADNQAKSYTPSLLNAISGKQQLPAVQRVSAGNALAYLGDPRFREDAWFLPDDPMLGFIEIPAGKFLMGSNRHWFSKPTQDEVTLPAYLIARYSVTVAQFQSFIKDSGHKPTNENSLRGLPNHPVVNVTWHDAIAYCDWLSNTLKAWKNIPQSLVEKLQAHQWRITLPSEAEWEKAARGSDARIYPYGNEFDADKANTSETGIGSTSAVGCFPNGASPYGLLDMSGNVLEWTRSIYKKYPYRLDDDRENLKAKLSRAARGGSWSYNQRDARCAYRGRVIPFYFLTNIGFRVVSPGS